MKLSISVREGLSFDLMVRACELAQALSRSCEVGLVFEKSEVYSPWRHLLSHEAQRELRERMVGDVRRDDAPRLDFSLINALDAGGRNDPRARGTREAALSAATAELERVKAQHPHNLLLCTAETTARYPTPEGAAVLLSLDGRTVASICVPGDGFAIGSPWLGPAAAMDGFHVLSCGVGADFYEVRAAARFSQVLVIADGDLARARARLQELRTAGVRAAVLFDPYRVPNDYADLCIEGMTIRCEGAVPPAERADLFSSCRAVVTTGARIDEDNHFVWEAAAAGVTPLGCHLPRFSPGDAWTAVKLGEAVAHVQNGSVPERTIRLGSWSEAAASIVANLGETRVALRHERLDSFAAGAHTVRLLDGLCSSSSDAETVSPAADRPILLCAGPGTTLSEPLLQFLQRHSQIHVYCPEVTRLVVDIGTSLFAIPVRYAADIRQTLGEILAGPRGQTADVLCVNLAQSEVAGLRRFLTGFSRHAGKAPLASLAALPRVLVTGTRPDDLSRLPRGSIGVNVACDNIVRSLELAAPGCVDLLWYHRPSHLVTARDNRNRIYFYPVRARAGHDGEQADVATLPWWLGEGRLGLCLSTDPYVGGFLSARSLWAERLVPGIGMLHSIHAADITTDAVFQLLTAPSYACDGFISPSACGAKAYAAIYAQASAWLEEQLSVRRKYQGSFHVVPFGIDASAYAGRNRLASRLDMDFGADELLLLSTGRFNRREKADLVPLLLAVKYLHERGHAVTLVLAGGAKEGAYVSSLEATCRELGIASAVRFLLNVSAEDKILLYAAADIFVSVSDNVQETFGLTLLEAMAAGLPVVASAWDGYREIVRHGETGFLVPSHWGGLSDKTAYLHRIAAGVGGYGHGDLHESVAIDLPVLCEQLEQLIVNRELRLEMGAKARRACIADYDLEEQGHKMIEHCLDAIQAARQIAWPPAEGRSLPFADFVSARFLHYASHHAEAQAWVLSATSEQASAWERVALELCGAAGGLEGIVARAIVALVKESGGRIRMGTLEEKLAVKFPLDGDECRRRILRCAKYGLVRIGS